MNGTILIVDDNTDLLKITQLIFKSRGYNTLTATTVEGATYLLQLHQPALIIMDACVCEEDDGRAFCERLKNDRNTNNIRIILTSGNDYPQEEWNGADDFLLKPFDFNEIVEKVEKQMTAVSYYAKTAS